MHVQKASPQQRLVTGCAHETHYTAPLGRLSGDSETTIEKNELVSTHDVQQVAMAILSEEPKDEPWT